MPNASAAAAAVIRSPHPTAPHDFIGL